ncbi:MAG: ubiquinol-cytochrome c reductase cytochrome b subunit [Micrococcales bacterium]|nr:MAG: ubiquinol-cytochrome c reductase cytochrome b subunit [Micrococcales bacterium]PIE27472.1 MAG: ubiquinol-cytochrome c reductase cytochrome b subunit [Micrococcales bacterium]
MSTTTNIPAPPDVPAPVAGTADWLDQRLGLSKVVRGFARKIFPDHWSFMLGEVALYSFVVLVLSGTFLTLFFVPSMGHTTYEGAYLPMNGQGMSEAYASTLKLSFDIRGGLLMRQVHHWSALLFVAAIAAHMFRVFFTGAFRKPREVNWVIGVVLALLALGAGFSGYSLPDDMLSGNGLRIIDGVVKSIPLVGTYVSFFLFGGEFPGYDIIPRLFVVHVMIIPAAIIALIGAHLALLVVHKHAQYPGPGRTNSNVVGYPLMPVYMAKAGGFFFVVFGIIALISATISINAVWNYGPYDPSPVSAGTQPDWYIGWIDGALRLMPGQLEWVIFGHTLSLNVLVPALVVPGVAVMAAMFYPFIEAAATGDKREHHLLDRPRNAPTRTGLGVMAIVAYCILWAAAGNDLMATHFDMSINDLTWAFRIGLFVVPPLAFYITRRICLGLQRKDREIALHGRETGRIVRTPEGEYYEVHEPLDEYQRWNLVQHETYQPTTPQLTDSAGIAAPDAAKQRRQARLSRFFFEHRVEPARPSELHHEQEDDHGHSELEDVKQ